MSKPATRRWAGGTAVTGVVLSLAGVGLVSTPASGAGWTCPEKGGTYYREPVQNYNDWNNLDEVPAGSPGSYQTPGDDDGIQDGPWAPLSQNLWYTFDGGAQGNGQVCFKWTQGRPHQYDMLEKGVLKNDVYVAP
jgi:hypothetical protein